jgi:hypothetical protein
MIGSPAIHGRTHGSRTLAGSARARASIRRTRHRPSQGLRPPVLRRVSTCCPASPKPQVGSRVFVQCCGGGHRFGPARLRRRDCLEPLQSLIRSSRRPRVELSAVWLGLARRGGRVVCHGVASHHATERVGIGTPMRRADGATSADSLATDRRRPRAVAAPTHGKPLAGPRRRGTTGAPSFRSPARTLRERSRRSSLRVALSARSGIRLYFGVVPRRE